MSKSNQLIALLNVWGIMLVVLGHSGFEEPVIAEKLSRLHSWIYSFHMPLFFFLSGYLFSLTNPDFTRIKPQAFFKKKVLRLLVPYVVLGIILWGIKFAFSSFSHADREFSLESFLMMFIAPGGANSTMGYLWYIVTLFFLFVVITAVSWMGINLRKDVNCWAMIILCWSLHFIMPPVDIFNLKSLLWYMPFFLIGISYQTHEKVLIDFIFKPSVSKTGGGIALTISLLGVYHSIPTPIGGLFERMILAVSGIFFSILLCHALLKLKPIQDKLLPFSTMTYSIYLLSWFGQYAAKIVTINILNLHWGICVVVMFVGGLLVPIIVCKIVDKIEGLKNNKFLRLSIGY